ncbi:MAG: M1 family aminopeptidase [Verrucomicrobiota bacterium]
MKFLSPLLLAALTVTSSGAGHAEEDCLGNCGKVHLLPLGGEIKPGRKYARDRLADIEHVALDVTPDFKNRTVSGTVAISFSPIGLPLSTLALDSVDLSIDKVSVTGAVLADHQVTAEQLLIQFAKPIEPGAKAVATITWHAEPKKGLHFRTPELGYPAGDTQVWTQGEAEEHRFWFPCYDYPNERFTSEITCHVPAGMEVVSNGVLAEKIPGAAGLTAWHWRQNQPHVNYLMALAAGNFHKLENTVGKLPIALLVPPSEKDQAAGAFRDTKAIMEFLQEEIGVPFPWDKYYQVYCHDFLAGGMENTSCSFMAAGLLFPKETGELDTLHRLDAHEMAHQWFGDLMTCRDWSHLWLNEGFASYYTVLYEERKNGRDGMFVSLSREADRVIKSKDRRPIVWRDYGDPMQQFDSRAYPKGAWVLHMLRSQLGKALYQKAIRVYIERHRNGIVTTDDLQEILEEVSGKSLDQFFDQWVHHGGVPELKADYSWDADRKQARVTIRQAQKVDAEVLLFRLPLPVRFTFQEDGKTVTRDVTVTVSKAEETFYFPLPAQPDLVRLDPDLTILADWEFTPPPDMLKRQLDADFGSRYLALGILAERKDAATVAQLTTVIAAKDQHHALRTEAVRALGKIGTPAARTALIPILAESDERVRQAAVSALAAIYHPEPHEALVKLAATEKNPDILASLVRSFAAWPEQDLLKWLDVPSYHQQVAAAALDALGDQNKTAAAPVIRDWLKAKGGTLTQRDLASALGTLGALSRNTADPTIQPFLATYLTDYRESVRTGAARALGELRDVRSLPMLAGLSLRKTDAASSAATAAITAINASRTSTDQTQEAWKKVEDLVRKTEEMEKKLEKLENRDKAKPTP